MAKVPLCEERFGLSPRAQPPAKAPAIEYWVSTGRVRANSEWLSLNNSRERDKVTRLKPLKGPIPTLAFQGSDGNFMIPD